MTRALEVCVASEFEWIWNDLGTGAKQNITFWRVSSPSDARGPWYTLGDVAVPAYEFPSVHRQTAALVVRALEEPTGAPPLLPPVGYEQLWCDRGSGARHDLSLWRPIPPEGYVAVGCVAQSGWVEPVREDVRCVRADLAMPAHGEFVWSDTGSGADHDAAVWAIAADSNASVSTGGFATVGRHDDVPENTQLWAVMTRAVVMSTGQVCEDWLEIPRVEPAEPSIEVRHLGADHCECMWYYREGRRRNRAEAPLRHFYEPSSACPRGFLSLGSVAGRDAGITVVRGLVDGALVHPVDAEMVWSERGSRSKMPGSFWRLIPPSDDYVALGYVAQRGYLKPTLERFAVVRRDLVVPATLETREWWDTNTGASQDLSVWGLVSDHPAGVDTGRVVCSPHPSAPYPHPAWTLSAAHVTGDTGLFGVIDTRGDLVESHRDMALVRAHRVASWTRVWQSRHGWAAAQPAGTPGFMVGHMVCGTEGSTLVNAVAGYTLSPMAGAEGLLAHPVSFKDIGGGHVWLPVAPAGFVSLGVFFSEARGVPPDPSTVVCVHRGLVLRGTATMHVWQGRIRKQDLRLFYPLNRPEHQTCQRDAHLLVGAVMSGDQDPWLLRAVCTAGNTGTWVPPSVPVTERELVVQLALEYTSVCTEPHATSAADAQFFNPVVPPGMYMLGSSGWCASGHEHEAGGGASLSQLHAVLVSPVSEASRPLARAVDVTHVARLRGGDIWQPVAPPGYVAMGVLVVSRKRAIATTPLSLDTVHDMGYRCVREDLTTHGVASQCAYRGSEDGGRDVSCWRVRSLWGDRAVDCGTLTAVANHAPVFAVSLPTLIAAYLQRPCPDLSPEQEDELITAHGPRICFHPDERYEPVNIDDYLSRCQLKRGRRVLDPVSRETLAKYADWQLQLRDPDDRAGDVTTAEAHVHVVNRALTTDIQFWMLYAYNGAGTMRIKSLLAGWGVSSDQREMTPIGEHEGDWEVIILRFANLASDATHAALPELVDVGITAHGDTTWFAAATCEHVGGRVMAYASLNGHAGYRHAGPCYSEHHKHANTVEWMLVNACSEEGAKWDLCDQYRVVARTSGDGETEFLDSAMAFRGRWGIARHACLDSKGLRGFAWRVLWPLFVMSLPIPIVNVVVGGAALTLTLSGGLLDKVVQSFPEQQNGPKSPRLQRQWFLRA